MILTDELIDQRMQEHRQRMKKVVQLEHRIEDERIRARNKPVTLADQRLKYSRYLREVRRDDSLKQENSEKKQDDQSAGCSLPSESGH